MWEKIISLIENNQTFVITSHINPDCDALGSELALAEHLRNLGKEVKIINSDPVPRMYRFIDPKKKAKKYADERHLPLIQEAQVIIVVDASGGWKRIGCVGEVLEPAKGIKVCIDHHPDPVDFVDVAVVDTDVAATAELIYDLIIAMNGTLSPNMAKAIYAAIVTDSGNFRFPKTNPHTHRITADLLALGINPYQIYTQLYQQYSLAQVSLKGLVMASIKTEADGQIAYYCLERKTLQAYDVKVSELDGFASMGQKIKGVRVVIFCVESSKKRIKFSLRSNGTVVVNQIAAEYAGGGHHAAAGATVEGNLHEVMATLVAKVKALLEAEIVQPPP